MKELEQEQEVLLQGLEMMARGREWYQQQLQRVRDRQRRLSQSRAGAVSAGPPTLAVGTQAALGGLSLDSELKLGGGRDRSARCRNLLMAWCSLPLFQDFGTAGSPLPLGRLLPKVQEVARCLGELLTAACSGRVSALEPPWHPLPLLWMLCLIVYSHRLCPRLPWVPPLPQHQSGSSRPFSC